MPERPAVLRGGEKAIVIVVAGDQPVKPAAPAEMLHATCQSLGHGWAPDESYRFVAETGVSSSDLRRKAPSSLLVTEITGRGRGGPNLRPHGRRLRTGFRIDGLAAAVGWLVLLAPGRQLGRL